MKGVIIINLGSFFGEKIVSFISRDNITLVLSIFGSLGTIFTLLHSFVSNRKNIDVRIIGHRYTDSHSLLIYVAFENKSRLPIAITGISVFVEDVPYSCAEPPVVALKTTSRTGKTITSHHEYRTLTLPVNLPSLGGTSGYVFFETPEATFQTDATPLKFLINSNRGRVMKNTLPLERHLDRCTFFHARPPHTSFSPSYPSFPQASIFYIVICFQFSYNVGTGHCHARVHEERG